MKVPAYIDAAYDNLNDILRALSNSGLEDLKMHENKFDKVSITRLGLLVEMSNRDEKPFSVLVMDNADKNTFITRLKTVAKNLKKKNRR